MKTVLIFFLGIIFNLSAQNSVLSNIKFSGDFRFRVEQDWNSRKSDGTYRDDRSRLRYRARLGVNYKFNDWANVGVRVRTGDPKKQQDPQITLGDASKEFGTLPIGFEKLFFEVKHKNFLGWLGKNTFPFKKNNEQFWSDNVYPEGVFLKNKFVLNSKMFNDVNISIGHFIVATSGESLDNDGYFEGLQTSWTMFNKKLSLFPSLYLFKNMPNIPDGDATFVFDYTVFHVGGELSLSKKPLINLEADYYNNIEDYSSTTNIPNQLKNETEGFVAGVSYGALKTKGDWFFKLTYNYLEQYAAVDFLAQNDWVRWDYSSFNSPDGRLTNYKGTEFVTAYKLNKNMTFKMKCYFVDQLVAYGNYKENGNRIRFDFDVKF
ncbi:hypothetical protein GCM10022291_30000 [Postechiella marina]|uniref:Porin n=1 Tax=Postechiella marina TaxID=943941 RepID=A0ABP8CG58_9FLAO